MGMVVQAFAHRGIDATIAPLRRTATHTRRRAAFGVTRAPSGVILGFREEGQHRLVGMTECVILDKTIVAALPELRELAGHVLPKHGPGGRLIVTRLDHGLDVSLEIEAKSLPPETLQRVAALARRAGIIRLSLGGEMVMGEAARR